MSMAKTMAGLINGGALPTISVSLSNHTFDNEAETGPVSASFVFGNTGILSGDVYSEGVQPSMQWLTSVSAPSAALYDLYVSKVSGYTPTAGTLDTWQNLGTSRTYTNTRNALGERSSVLNVRLRVTATGSEVANVNFTLRAKIWPESGA